MRVIMAAANCSPAVAWDVLQCGAMSLQQKPLHHKGIHWISLLAKTKFVGSDWW
jgi:hypothetical protein